MMYITTQGQIKTESWSYDGKLIVCWDGVLLVYPDFYGTNTLQKRKVK